MLHEILKDFRGSQDGRFTESFKAGTRAELSDYLAAIVVREGWARPVRSESKIQNKAIISDGSQSRAMPPRRKGASI